MRLLGFLEGFLARGASSDLSGRENAEDRLRDSEAQLRAMVAELQHRTRNLLTVVSGIADQTLATSSTLEAFGAGFDQRLAALGRVQGLISRDIAMNVTLRELVALELTAHGAEPGQPGVHVEGPDVILGPRELQLLALALHELTTNAVKHGALAHRGRLDIAWRVLDRDGTPVLRLLWTERDVPRATDEPPSGFGRQLIESTLPYELDAQTRMEFTPDGLRCSIELLLHGAG